FLEKYALNIPNRISKVSVTFQLSKGILSHSIQHMFGKCYYFSGQKDDFLQIFFEQDITDKLEQFVRYFNE
ncbi:PLP-dependent aminotransferase family protein, partial [Streptococcus suis]